MICTFSVPKKPRKLTSGAPASIALVGSGLDSRRCGGRPTSLSGRRLSRKAMAG